MSPRAPHCSALGTAKPSTGDGPYLCEAPRFISSPCCGVTLAAGQSMRQPVSFILAVLQSLSARRAAPAGRMN